MSYPMPSLSGNTLATLPSLTSSHPQSTPDESLSPPTAWLDEPDKHGLYLSPEASPASSLASVDTYASTIASQEDLDGYDAEPYSVAEPVLESYSDVPAASSKEFAQLFPSTRRLHIRHDDSTEDGNMNLRVNTTMSPSSGRPREVQMFHLRLHDLRSRDFSFRRYCRDSNREICHSCRKVQRPVPEKRPSLQRSLSHAFSLLRPTSSHKVQALSPSIPRHDSGYDSMDDPDMDDLKTNPVPSLSQPLDDSISLEFSNYAQCVLRRRGPAKKHYDFDYWGSSYSWQRTVHNDRSARHVSFRLVRRKGNEVIAHIAAVPLSPEQAQDETDKGGWIPPCSMWISDQATIDGPADVCDAVIATGLIALVDDSIRRRFHSKSVRQLVVPLAQLSKGNGNGSVAESIEPNTLIYKAFGAPE